MFKFICNLFKSRIFQYLIVAYQPCMIYDIDIYIFYVNSNCDWSDNVLCILVIASLLVEEQQSLANQPRLLLFFPLYNYLCEQIERVLHFMHIYLTHFLCLCFFLSFMAFSTYKHMGAVHCYPTLNITKHFDIFYTTFHFFFQAKLQTWKINKINFNVHK